MGWLRGRIMVLDPVRADANLAAGGVPCGGCGRALAPWGWARQRRVQGSPLADAVEALASAASAAVRLFGPLPVPWPLIAVIAGGLLLAPPTG